MWKRTILAVFLACGVCSGQALPDRLTVPQVRVEPPNTLRAFVSVLDEHGSPVPDLGPANFAVMLDGKSGEQLSIPSSKLSLRPSEQALDSVSVVLAFDVSGSMAGAKIAAVRQGATNFIRNLRSQDYCAMMAFGNSVQWINPDFTRDRDSLVDQLQKLQAHDARTVLNDAFFRAAEKAKNAPTTQVAVVVLTDGIDEGSNITLDQAIREVQARNVPVYAIGFGRRADMRSLGQITTLTGGRSYSASSGAELLELYSQVLRQLSSYYVLEASLPELPSGEHKLTLRLDYRGQILAAAHSFNFAAGKGDAGDGLKTQATKRSWMPALLIGAGIAGVLLVVLLLVRKRPGSTAQGSSGKCIYCGAVLAAGDQNYCGKCSGSSAAASQVAPQDSKAPAVAQSTALPADYFEVLDGSGKGVQVPVTGDLTIGRDKRQSVIVDGDRHVSREHAKVHRDGNGRWVMTNIGAGGTYINGKKTEIPEVLQNGDRIGLGSPEPKLVFHAGAAKSS